MMEFLYNHAINNNADIVRCGNRTMFGPLNFGGINSNGYKCGSGTIINPKEIKDYVFKETISPCNKLIRRELIDDLRFPEKTKWEDIAVIRPVLAHDDKIVHLNEQKYIYNMHLFNTTMKDFIIPIIHVLDIFKTCDAMENNFKKINLYELYKESIRMRQIFSCMLRVDNAGLWFKLEKENRIELANALVNLIELKYGEWQNNPFYLRFKNNNFFFRYTMDYIEQKVLDESLQLETSEGKVYTKIHSIFEKQ